MADERFWDSMSDETRVKVNIVSKYFSFWSMASTGGKNPSSKISYIDLFSGRGVYKDGTPSTPVRVISSALRHQPTTQALQSLFCESQPEIASILREALLSLPQLDDLTVRPTILNQSVNESLIPYFEDLVRFPTLSFVDPYGYEGVTAGLLSQLLSHRKSELILFFNFNRFNAALSNPYVLSHARAFFGSRADHSISYIEQQTSPKDREHALVHEVGHLLGDLGASYVQLFRFQQEYQERTSHYLVFATKSTFPLDKMKEIMSSESSEIDGITAFGWLPNTDSQLSLPIHGLVARQSIKELVRSSLTGTRLTFGEIYDRVGLLSPFAKKDFQNVINEMEEQGEVSIDKPREKRWRNGKLTLGKDRVVAIRKE